MKFLKTTAVIMLLYVGAAKAQYQVEYRVNPALPVYNYCMKNTVPLPNGESIIVSTVYRGQNDEDIMVKRLTAGGSVTWCYTYGLINHIERGISITEAIGGNGYVVTGTYQQQNDFYTLVFQIDLSGALLWSHIYMGQMPVSSPNAICPTLNNDGYIITGQSYNNNRNNFFCMKIDASGALMWSNIYDDNLAHNGSEDRPENILADPVKKRYIIVGTSMQSSRWAFYMSIDDAGNIVNGYERVNIYDSGNETENDGVSICSDKQYNRFWITFKTTFTSVKPTPAFFPLNSSIDLIGLNDNLVMLSNEVLYLPDLVTDHAPVGIYFMDNINCCNNNHTEELHIACRIKKTDTIPALFQMGFMRYDVQHTVPWDLITYDASVEMFANNMMFFPSKDEYQISGYNANQHITQVARAEWDGDTQTDCLQHYPYANYAPEPTVIDIALKTTAVNVFQPVALSRPVELITPLDCHNMPPQDKPLRVGNIKENEQLTLSPNPANDQLNIASATIDIQGSYTVFIYDAKGALAGQYSLNSGTVNISNLSPGIYTLKLCTSENTQTARFIKE